eukprot:364760-Chlamydomonas_euryale.AAC.3
MVHCTRRHAARGQPGRQLGGVVSAQHAVARVKVGRHQVAIKQIVLQACKRLRLATLPGPCGRRLCGATSVWAVFE